MIDIFDEIKTIEPQALESHGIITPARAKVNGYNTYICPFCGNGTGDDGTGLTVTVGNGGRINYRCFGKCATSYGNFELIAEHEGLNADTDKAEIVRRAKEIFNLSDDSNDFSFKETKKFVGSVNAMKEQTDENFKKTIERANKNLKSFIKSQGGKWRGLTFDTLNFFRCGFLSDWVHPKAEKKYPTPRVIIPTNDFEYLARRIDDKKEYAKQQAGGVKTPFNLDKVHADKPIFIVEGEIDCMSIYQSSEGNFQSIATRGASNLPNFVNAIDVKFHSSKDKPKFIILFDKDKNETGQTMAVELKRRLNDAGYLATIKFFNAVGMDSNEYLVKAGFESLLGKLTEFYNESVEEFKTMKLEKPADKLESANNTADVDKPAENIPTLGVSLIDYLKNNFRKERELMQVYSARKTGFENIDENQILLPGLYVLGGVPSAGKTAFCWQLAEQMARQGETVFYFSYEVKQYQLSARTLSRETYKQNTFSSLSSADIQIKRGTSPAFEKVFADLENETFKLYVIDIDSGISEMTADRIIKYLIPICESSQQPPTVFIDYLQIMPTDIKAGDSIKNTIDDTLKKLKDFQQKTQTTFFIVSSFNRVNYDNEVDFESFKESGGIEYTADVIFGLQFEMADVTTTKIFERKKAINEKKRQTPRLMKIKCLKNRQGRLYDAWFNYYSKFDYFQETTQESVYRRLGIQDDSISDAGITNF